MPSRLAQRAGEAQPAAVVDHQRSALLRHATVADVHDAVGDPRGTGVVRDHEQRRAGARRERDEQVVDDVGRRAVELAGRLVGQDHRRLVGDGGADRDALQLAARERQRHPSRDVLQADLVQQGGGRGRAPASGVTPRSRRPRPTADAQSMLGRHTGQGALHDEAERRPPVVRQLRAAQLPQLVAGHRRTAGAGPLVAGQHAQQGRLARAARALHEHPLAGRDVERQAAQRRDVVLAAAVDAEQVADARSRARSRRPGRQRLAQRQQRPRSATASSATAATASTTPKTASRPGRDAAAAPGRRRWPSPPPAASRRASGPRRRPRRARSRSAPACPCASRACRRSDPGVAPSASRVSRSSAPLCRSLRTTSATATTATAPAASAASSSSAAAPRASGSATSRASSSARTCRTRRLNGAARTAGSTAPVAAQPDLAGRARGPAGSASSVRCSALPAATMNRVAGSWEPRQRADDPATQRGLARPRRCRPCRRGPPRP